MDMLDRKCILELFKGIGCQEPIRSVGGGSGGFVFAREKFMNAL